MNERIFVLKSLGPSGRAPLEQANSLNRFRESWERAMKSSKESLAVGDGEKPGLEFVFPLNYLASRSS